MNSYLQEAFSRKGFPSLHREDDQSQSSVDQYFSRRIPAVTVGHSSAFPIEFHPKIETTGGSLSAYFIFVCESSNLIRQAWNTLGFSLNQEVVQSAKMLLLKLHEIVTSFCSLGFDLGDLPPVIAFNLDDGSVLIEWIFKDFRIGFNLEQNSDESGWYLVSNASLGAISAFGHLEVQNTDLLLLWLINFAISNT